MFVINIVGGVEFATVKVKVHVLVVMRVCSQHIDCLGSKYAHPTMRLQLPLYNFILQLYHMVVNQC
jgi:hypothetical protein